MERQSAPRIEGLPDRSITRFGERELREEGIRGVDGPLGMTAKARAFGPVLIVEAEGTGSEFERRPSRPDLPTIDLLFVQQGEFEYLDAGAWRPSRGPLMIAPSGLPNRVRVAGPWRFVVARIPREALLLHAPTLDDRVSIHEELTLSERSLAVLLSQSVQSEQAASEADARLIARTVLEMAGAVLRARQCGAWDLEARQAGIRDRAFAMIRRDAADQGLDPERIAAGAGVSLRYLQEIFAAGGSSVAAELRKERARIARSLLQDPGSGGLGATEIALRSGFGSSASMRRALATFYRLGPSELRQRGGEQLASEGRGIYSGSSSS